MPHSSEAQFFAELPCPVGSWVGHFEHGQGQVTAANWHSRSVAFHREKQKERHEMSEEELHQNSFSASDYEDIICVRWLEIEKLDVPVAELTCFGQPPNEARQPSIRD